jgi:uncharacterized protein YaiL (DUF2058 family)
LVNRKNDPNYQQISAYVDKDLAIRFKQLIASKSLNISEGLEEALQAYLDAKHVKDASQESK